MILPAIEPWRHVAAFAEIVPEEEGLIRIHAAILVEREGRRCSSASS